MIRALAASILCAAASACGGGNDAMTDAGAGDASIDAGLAVAPPDIPWLEQGAPTLALTPCPEGWREVIEEGRLTTCDPYPEGGPSECAFGQAHFPGEPGCRPIGDPCPAGEWPEGVPSDEATVVFVRAGATGGDGTRALPFGALSEVPWSSRGAGWTIALAKGRYPGVLPLRAGVGVIGACVAETILTGSGSPASSVVTVTSAGEPAVVRNLAIVDAPQGGVSIESRRSISMLGVAIIRATDLAVFATGAGTGLSMTDVVLEATRPSASGAHGRGVDVELGASLVAERLLVSGSHEFGVFVAGADATATLTDSVVRDTEAQTTDRAHGRGIAAYLGAHLDATRFVASGNQDVGVSSEEAGTTVTLVDGVVRDTAAASDGTSGRGVNVQSGASLHATRVVVSRNREVGVAVNNAGSLATLDDTIVADTLGRERDALGGAGVTVGGGSGLEMTRAVVQGNHEFGIFVEAMGTSVTLSDVAVSNTLAGQSDGRAGRGLNVQTGARVSATRLLVSGSRDVGLFAAAAGTAVTLTDTVIRDTTAQESDATGGRGLVVQQGAQCEATRLAVSASHEVGVYGWGPETTLTLVDAVVRDTQPGASGDGGYGVGVFEATHLTATRLVVTGSHGAGLVADGSDTTVVLTDAEVSDTEGPSGGYGLTAQYGARVDATGLHVSHAREAGVLALVGASVDARSIVIESVLRSACDCPERGFGYAAVALGGAMRLEGFTIRDSATCGLFLAAVADHETALDVASGVVERSAIGACVQIDGYDLGRLSLDVLYRDNESNLASTMLPVPDGTRAITH